MFVFDFARDQPRMLGQLEIPGFATYLHPLSGHRLLTVGRGAQAQGGGALLGGVRLQLIDAAVAQNPRLLHYTTIGTAATKSAALSDHLAFSYFLPQQLLALPLMHEQKGHEKGDSAAALMLYQVNSQSGFHLRGQVQMPQEVGELKRAIVMGPALISVFPNCVQVNRLDKPNDRATVVSWR